MQSSLGKTIQAQFVDGGPRIPKSSDYVPEGQEIRHLHEPIIKWCESQHPRIPYVHSRTDKKSTTGKGVCDFLIAYQGKVYFIECKTRTGKLSPDQLAFALLLSFQGFKLHVIRSMKEFFEVVK